MLDSKAQSEQCYVAMCFFYWSKVRWQTENDENVDFPFPTLSQTSKRVLHEGNISRITWMEDWKGNIVSFGISKYQIQRKVIKVLKMEKKTGKIRMLLELTYLLFSKWFKSFLQITGRAHPHNSWNNKHKRPRDPTLGGQTDLISTFWSTYFEHHSHNFYNPNPLILKL